MKKTLALLLALILALGTVPALAEEIPAEEPAIEVPAYDELVVGSTTAMSGCFFTDLWGSNTTDIDVRTLLHGYNLIEWKTQTSSFGIDESVLSGIIATQDFAGNRTYTIALYNDLFYSDGTPITAWDYAFSMLLTTSPEIAAIGANANRADYIVGIDAYKAGETNVLSGVRVENDYQLSITVKAEYLPFFYELALLDCTPYPISVIAPGCEVADDGEGVYIRSANGEGDPFTAELLQQTIFGENGYMSNPSVVSGPYTLTSYDAAAATASFAINPYYKGNSLGAKPLIPRIIVKHVTNANLVDQLASGEVGLVNKCVNAETLNAGMALAAEGAVNVSNYARNGYSFISFNCERPLMTEAVRKAIAYCFDKDAFIGEYVSNYGIRVDGYYGIGQWMYRLATGALEPPLEEPAAGADRETVTEYEEEVKAWEELNMDEVPVYNLDLPAARTQLINDGWTLNGQGQVYNQGDAVRAREIGGEVVPLQLKLYYPEGNAAGAQLGSTLVENLKQVGIELTVEAKPFAELLRIYYRQDERDCDMIYMATNFSSVFDPSATFALDDAAQGVNNRTAIRDQQLYDLAVQMRSTEPGDILTYCQHWVEFQIRYAEILPTLPVYSNVYFDFYSPTLHDYVPGAEPSWADAIIGAYLGDPDVVEEEVEEDDFEIID